MTVTGNFAIKCDEQLDNLLFGATNAHAEKTEQKRIREVNLSPERRWTRSAGNSPMKAAEPTPQCIPPKLAYDWRAALQAKVDADRPENYRTPPKKEHVDCTEVVACS